MIKLKSLLKESSGFELPHWSGNVKFTPSSKDGKIILVPSSMKDVDGIDVIKQKIGGAATQSEPSIETPKSRRLSPEELAQLGYSAGNSRGAMFSIPKQQRKGNPQVNIAAKKAADADFLELLKQQLEKKLKLKVELDRGYSGAGYAFQIDMDDLLKKL